MATDKRDLYIVGAGGVGRHILDNKIDYGLSYGNIFFIDDSKELIGSMIGNSKVVGDLNFLKHLSLDVDVVLGISDPQLKQQILTELEGLKNLNFPSLISKHSWVSSDVNIGIGSIVYPNSSINTGTTIEDFVHINMNCSIGHDCTIGKASFLAPGVKLGGWTNLGRQCSMGIASTTIQNIGLARESIVGAACLVNKSYNHSVRLVGIPCREIQAEIF